MPGDEDWALTCSNIPAGYGAGDELFVCISPGPEDGQQPRNVELHVVVSLANIRNITAEVVGPDISSHTCLEPGSTTSILPHQYFVGEKSVSIRYTALNNIFVLHLLCEQVSLLSSTPGLSNKEDKFNAGYIPHSSSPL